MLLVEEALELNRLPMNGMEDIDLKAVIL